MRWTFLFAIAVLGGCVAEQSLTERYVTNTPDTYVENKVFFVGAVDGNEFRPLRHYFEPPANKDSVVLHGQPLAVLISGVRIPEDLDRRIDAAVVLDLYTGVKVEESRTSLIVWYQRNVGGGQMLNFQNLLVYADDNWDSAYPPYFRIRVLDVAAERNATTRQLLEQCSQLASALGPLVPTSAVPAVGIAMQAAKAVLGNQKNKVLLSYDVQFYSQHVVGQAGEADLGMLQKGTWLVVGRPQGTGASFWRTSMWLDRRTDELLREVVEGEKPARVVLARTPDGKKECVPVPYVRMTVATAHQIVPSIVQERTQALLTLLTSPHAGQDLEEIESLGEKIKTTADTYVTIRRVRRFRSGDAMLDLVNRIKNSVDKTRVLPDGDVAILVAEVERLAGKSMQGGPAVKDWWDSGGGKEGSFPSTGEYKWVWTGP